MNLESLYEQVIPSVPSIYVRQDADHPGGAGSGFVYDEQTVVTNEHVVHGAEEVDLRFHDGTWRVGSVQGHDVYTDLAVVDVPDLPERAVPLPLATDPPAPGRSVAAFGNPLGLHGTVTAGIVSGTGRSVAVGGGFTIPDTVQTDAAINPGNSGGPLVATTADGDPIVAGVNRAKAGDNVGFAVSARLVDRVVPVLQADGSYPHAMLHVRTIDVSPSVAAANDLPDTEGVLIVDVGEGPADGVLAGCHDTRTVRGREVPVGGDVIVAIDDTPVRTHEELLTYLITETRPDEPVAVEVLRAGGHVTETIELAPRPPMARRERRRLRRPRGRPGPRHPRGRQPPADSPDRPDDGDTRGRGYRDVPIE